MRPDNKYYGEAIREVEKEGRRDDLWGRAVAESYGDVQRSQSIYIELLAKQLAIEDGQPSTQQQLEGLKQKGSKTVKFLLWWLFCVIACGVLASGATALISKSYYDKNYQTALDKRSETFEFELQKLQSDLSSQGYQISFEQLKEDWTLPIFELQNKYQHQAALSISSFYLSTTRWDYQDKVDSRISDETQGKIGYAIFFGLLACSWFWKKSRRQS